MENFWRELTNLFFFGGGGDSFIREPKSWVGVISEIDCEFF